MKCFQTETCKHFLLDISTYRNLTKNPESEFLLNFMYEIYTFLPEAHKSSLMSFCFLRINFKVWAVNSSVLSQTIVEIDVSVNRLLSLYIQVREWVKNKCEILKRSLSCLRISRCLLQLFIYYSNFTSTTVLCSMFQLYK